MTVPAAPAARSATAANPEFPHLRAFVAELAAGGLRHVCISPGARSTPLTVSFAREPRTTCWSHIDERSNAFFALGIAKATRSPAAIVCTSGTAAANFFPAIIEAAHAGVPLIVLTADRPAELRDCEAGQAIDQIKLYGDYAKWFAEVGMQDSGLPYFRTLARRALREAASVPRGVVHLNFPLREPLIADGGHRDDVTLEPAATVAPVVVPAGAPHPQAEDLARLVALIKLDDARPHRLRSGRPEPRDQQRDRRTRGALRLSDRGRPDLTNATRRARRSGTRLLRFAGSEPGLRRHNGPRPGPSFRRTAGL